MVFEVAPGQRLIFVADAVTQMQAFAQRLPRAPEAGGVLLGRLLEDSNHLVVDEVTTPQDTDKRTRFSFFRSRKHETLARRRWEACRSKLAYLGLWHTHPETNPSPSGVDLRDWRQAVSQDTFEGERLFFPIVGTDCIRVWSADRTGAVTELVPEILKDA